MSGAAGPIPLADAMDIAGMMVRTGRAVPPGDWVADLIEDEQRAGLELFMSK